MPCDERRLRSLATGGVSLKVRDTTNGLPEFVANHKRGGQRPAARLGTEKGSTPSQDYCTHCYQNGEFTWQAANLDEAVAGNVEFWEREENETDEQLFARVKGVFLQLKRWKAA